MATTKTKSPTKRFRVLLETDPAGSAATGILVPFDVQKVFGTRARVPVRGNINGFPYRGSIFPMGGGKHYMIVNAKIRAGANVKGGEPISMTMERDEEPRTVEPSADFARALRGNKQARSTWDALSFTHRREYAEWIEEAKKPETRERRIAKAVEALAAGKKERYDRQ
ncbi:MAG: YdeI/OmpD-associated family protein [Acidobacteria bacterium]|nr:YdeI/OmpD-associated family protein [Acidobacteriota bacterium]MCA1643165.1 YdeI/OmpD-associated family protein [Acidobacteriota bacterium]